MFDPLVLDPLTIGTATGIGHSFGQRLFAWVSRLWNRSSPTESAPVAASEPAIDSVAEQNAVAEELVAELKKVRTEDDYEQFVAGLGSAGLPLDSTTVDQLHALRQEVLDAAASKTVCSLAEIAASALQRVGVEPPDLRRWESLADRIAAEELDASETCETRASSAPVHVALARRPKTFWVWNRQEVDRRYLNFIGRIVRDGRSACREYVASGDDIAALRKVKEVGDRLEVLEGLLATTPTLAPQTGSLRLDGKRIKELVARLEAGVEAAESLNSGLNNLLGRKTVDAEWTTSADGCLRATARLDQELRARRSVR